ncbi:MAG: flagellar protein FliT [Methylococcales bacterium]|nr:flagellar protein FliT [Methylococcales bacterium]
MSALLQELNGFSLRIAQAIESNDWEQLTEILMQRQARLETLLNVPLSENEQHAIQGVLESIQAMDSLFVDTVQSKKTELLKDFKSVAQGQKVVRAYYATATN